MTISWLQAALLGLFACLSSMPGLGGTSFGNYTLGRPLIGGLVYQDIIRRYQNRYFSRGSNASCLHCICTSLLPSESFRSKSSYLSYIGIPLAMVALNSYGLSAATKEGTALATSFGTMVGTLGTVLFYGTATINLAWQHVGWKAVEKEIYINYIL